MNNVIILANATGWPNEPRNVAHWQRVVLWAQLCSHLDEDDAILWMRSPHAGLDGRTPHEALPEEVVEHCPFPKSRIA
jgi:hypothetical protein